MELVIGTKRWSTWSLRPWLVLKRAGANPPRATLVAGMESLKGYDNGILGPITWSATDHVGTHSTFPVVCCSDDNTWRTAGPPRTAY